MGRQQGIGRQQPRRSLEAPTDHLATGAGGCAVGLVVSVHGPKILYESSEQHRVLTHGLGWFGEVSRRYISDGTGTRGC